MCPHAYMRHSPPVEYLYLLLLVGGLVHTLEATGQQLCQDSGVTGDVGAEVGGHFPAPPLCL